MENWLVSLRGEHPFHKWLCPCPYHGLTAVFRNRRAPQPINLSIPCPARQGPAVPSRIIVNNIPGKLVFNLSGQDSSCVR